MDFLRAPPDTIRLMTHVVAGYPDLTTNKRLVQAMAEAGAGMVEIQIPFSDPLADGPTIMRANQHALDRGIRLRDCFALMETLAGKVSIPLLFMTYGNLAYSYGIERFVINVKKLGCRGIIIPDLPYDEQIDNLNDICQAENLPNIQVFSPGISRERMKAISGLAQGFVYATLKVGVTGARDRLDPEAMIYLQTLRSQISLPIAAGFGISSPPQVRALIDSVDIAVIGSHLIEVHDTGGVEAVEKFIRDCL